jgi:hypothetical protein
LRSILLRHLVFLFAASLWTRGVCAAEKTSRLEYGAEVVQTSRYVWRGIALSDGPVTQPSLWVSRSKLTGELWSNFDLKDARRCNEVDFTLTYAAGGRALTVEPSLQLYVCPGVSDAPTTEEVLVRLSRPVGPVTLFTRQSVDLLVYPGAYFGEIGVSGERAWGSRTTVEAEGRLGWGSSRFNAAYLETRKTALNYAALDIGVKHSFLHSSYGRVSLGLSQMLDGELRQHTAHPFNLLFGLTVGADF